MLLALSYKEVASIPSSMSRMVTWSTCTKYPASELDSQLGARVKRAMTMTFQDESANRTHDFHICRPSIVAMLPEAAEAAGGQC
jgi:hypothetical protein